MQPPRWLIALVVIMILNFAGVLLVSWRHLASAYESSDSQSADSQSPDSQSSALPGGEALPARAINEDSDNAAESEELILETEGPTSSEAKIEAPVSGSAEPKAPISQGRVSEGPVSEGPVSEGPIAEGPVERDAIERDPVFQEFREMFGSQADEGPLATPEPLLSGRMPEAEQGSEAVDAHAEQLQSSHFLACDARLTSVARLLAAARSLNAEAHSASQRSDHEAAAELVGLCQQLRRMAARLLVPSTNSR